MATIGLRDLYRAPITVEESGEEKYGTPVRMAKAISAEMSVEVAEAILYADDGADEVVKEFVSGELTLNVNDLMPADLAAILGQTQDDDQVVYAGENDDPPYMAIGFRAKKANGMYKYIWLYKVKFAIPSENYQTKGDSIEFTTPEITGQFIKRPDGLWKSRACRPSFPRVRRKAGSQQFESRTTLLRKANLSRYTRNKIRKGGTGKPFDGASPILL